MTRIYRESAEQRALFYWARLQTRNHPQLANLFRIPNGGRRTAREGARSKLEGEQPGVPDIFLAYPMLGSSWPHSPGTHGMFIEMKSPGEKLKEKQGEWRARLLAAGYSHKVCYSWVEAAKTICAYLGIPEDGL